MPIIHDPARRAQIIASRKQLTAELAAVASAWEATPRETRQRINRLKVKYGGSEVERQFAHMQERLNLVDDEDGAAEYQRYHAAYLRFGGARPALDINQWQALNHDWGMLYARSVASTHLDLPSARALSPQEEARHDELHDTLLKDYFLWEDIMPEDPGQGELPPLGPMLRQIRKRRKAQSATAK